MSLALEIHDAGLLAVDGDGPRGEASPGFALVSGRDLLVGRQAREQSRLRPRHSHLRFWEELATQPLGRPFPPELTTADLAHAHLRQVWKSCGGADSVLLVVPGPYSAERLSLLLGLAQAAGLPVHGLVDSAVAAAAGQTGDKLLHLDLLLHRLTVAEVRQGSHLERRRLESVQDAGLAAFTDAWARRVARSFVHATRFDPLHTAETEQALYDQLPGWLAELRRRDTVTASLGERTVELRRADAEGAAEPFFRHLLELIRSMKRAGEPATLLLSPHLSRLPGLGERLGELRDIELIELPPGAAGRGALASRAAIRAPADALSFVTRLPSTSPRKERPAASKAPANNGPTPSHLLLGSRAYAVGTEPLWLGREPRGSRRLTLDGDAAGISRTHCKVRREAGGVLVEDLSTYGSFVNGERVAERAWLMAGDRLRLGTPGIELLAIEIVDEAADG